METIRVVVCGFEWYEDVEVNPSAEVCQTLAREGIIADKPEVNIEVTSVLIPLSFQKAWPTLKTTLDAIGPDIVIATGLKTHAQSILLERCATNLIDANRPDADDAQPRRVPIIPDGPQAYWTRLPLHAVIQRFAEDKIPASLSSHAGTFVCNSLFYQLLHWADQRPRTLAGFVSLPLVNQPHGYTPGMSLGRMVDAVRDVVKTAVHYRIKPMPTEILRRKAA
ncbi:MAG: pyroglutamyl-peptidase I [Parascardovia denticolens]